MASAWSLSVLGRFRLIDGAEQEVALSARKTMGLLAALALAPDRSLRREQVIALLWSDRGPDQARSSLRQALVALKKEIGPELPVDIEGEVLRLAPEVRSDVTDFLKLSALEDEAALRQAAALFRGDLLEGVIIADDAFEGWLRDQRQRLRDVAARVLGALARAGHADQRIEAARRLVALDPLKEPSQLCLMQAHMAAGDMAAAIRQYETCCQMLKQDLGIAPGPDLKAYRESLTQGAAPPPPQQTPAAAKPTVAVLPFDNQGGDPDQRYFSDGVSEDIVNGLSRFGSLRVIARHSSFRYRDAAADIRAIGRDLGARYIVTGSVRRGGQRIRIAVQLVDSQDGRQIWSDRFDRELSDLFQVQDEVTQLVVSSLTENLETAEIRVVLSKPTDNLAAYEYLLRGVELLRSYGPGVNFKAVEMFEKALALDPNYGLAHGYLGISLLVAYEFENAPAEVKERALRHALQGVKLAPDDSRCHQYLGDAYLFTGNHDQGLAHYFRSNALNPNDANALTRLGIGLARVGRAKEGLAYARQAIANNPFHPDYYWADLGIAAFSARRYEEALAAFSKVAVHQRYWDHARMAACLAQLERLDEARAMAAAALRMKPDFRLSEERLNYKFKQDTDHVLNAMRKAGLPD